MGPKSRINIAFDKKTNKIAFSNPWAGSPNAYGVIIIVIVYKNANGLLILPHIEYKHGSDGIHRGGAWCVTEAFSTTRAVRQA